MGVITQYFVTEALDFTVVVGTLDLFAPFMCNDQFNHLGELCLVFDTCAQTRKQCVYVLISDW